MRGLAAVAREWLEGAQVFEPATFGVFTSGRRQAAASWTSSEYVAGMAPGASVHGQRREDLQDLSFADASFDLVITSEVLEHVEEPWVAFGEIRRVLRPGGRHVFTVPHVAGEPTTGRQGKPAVLHIDPMNPAGIPVTTDFGDDLPELLIELGFETHVHELPSRDRPVLRVYESSAV
jgi:SAM-dependent methyltransferase